MADKFINVGGHKLITNLDSSWQTVTPFTIALSNNGWQQGQTFNLGFTLEPGVYAMRLAIDIPLTAAAGEIIFNFGYGLLFVQKGIIWTSYIVNSVDKITSPVSTIGTTPYSSGLGTTTNVTIHLYFLKLN